MSTDISYASGKYKFLLPATACGFGFYEGCDDSAAQLRLYRDDALPSRDYFAASNKSRVFIDDNYRAICASADAAPGIVGKYVPSYSGCLERELDLLFLRPA